MQVMRRAIRVKSYLGAELTSVLQKLWANTLENHHSFVYYSQALSTFVTEWGWVVGGSTGNFSKIPWGTIVSQVLL